VTVIFAIIFCLPLVCILIDGSGIKFAEQLRGTVEGVRSLRLLSPAVASTAKDRLRNSTFRKLFAVNYRRVNRWNFELL
jgi:hypothetical protein